MVERFKLDENIPQAAETLLGNAGYEVETALDEQLGGSPDPKVFDVCQAEGRILITLDLDFADIRLYPPSSHPGIWVLRPSSQSIENTLALVRAALALLKRESATKRLWIIEPGRVRIRE